MHAYRSAVISSTYTQCLVLGCRGQSWLSLVAEVDPGAGAGAGSLSGLACAAGPYPVGWSVGSYDGDLKVHTACNTKLCTGNTRTYHYKMCTGIKGRYHTKLFTSNRWACHIKLFTGLLWKHVTPYCALIIMEDVTPNSASAIGEHVTQNYTHTHVIPRQ